MKNIEKMKEWFDKEQVEKKNESEIIRSLFSFQAEKIKHWFSLKEEQTRSLFSAQEEPTEDVWKHSMIALVIFPYLGLVFLSIYFITRKHPTNLQLKDGKWIYDVEKEPEDDIGYLEKVRSWIMTVFNKIFRKVMSWST